MYKNVLGFKETMHIKQLLGNYEDSFKMFCRSGNEIKTYCWVGGQKLINDQCSMTLHSRKEERTQL